MTQAMTLQTPVDAVIIGGGFYGSAIAIYLARERGFKRVVLLEKEKGLLMRASYTNQARVHNGYHYPRSFTTAYRSRINLPKFVRDWPQAVKKDFVKLYAIARRNSKVTARQFERFCHEIGASLNPVSPALQKLFSPQLIEKVYVVQEYAFDTTQLARWARDELGECGIDVRLQTQATGISHMVDNRLCVTTRDGNGHVESIPTRYVFNCAYSGLNQLEGDFASISADLKQEVTEMALMRMPPILRDIGVTVMDGPFFSLMPFPARGLHTLSHVRYTPHFNWDDKRGINPYRVLDDYDRATRVQRMVRDVGRYLPAILDADYVESLFEVKTVLLKNEGDDGRPILFEKHADLPGYYSILGGKIDNVYDVFEKMETEDFKGSLE